MGVLSGLGTRRTKYSAAPQHLTEVRKDGGAGLAFQATKLTGRPDVEALQEASSTHLDAAIETNK